MKTRIYSAPAVKGLKTFMLIIVFLSQYISILFSPAVHVFSYTAAQAFIYSMYKPLCNYNIQPNYGSFYNFHSLGVVVFTTIKVLQNNMRLYRRLGAKGSYLTLVRVADRIL